MDIESELKNIRDMVATDPDEAFVSAVSLINAEGSDDLRAVYINRIIDEIMPILVRRSGHTAQLLAYNCVKETPAGDEREAVIEKLTDNILPGMNNDPRSASKLASLCIDVTPHEQRAALIEKMVLVNPRLFLDDFYAGDLNGWEQRSMGSTPDGYGINAYISPKGAVLLKGGCFMGGPEAVVDRYADRPRRRHGVQYPLAKRLSKLSASWGFWWVAGKEAVAGVKKAAAVLAPKPA